MIEDFGRELIPVSIRRPSNARGTSTSQAFVVSLEDIVSEPGVHESLRTAEGEYRDSLADWRGLISAIERNRSDPVLRWSLAESVDGFRRRMGTDWGLEPTNYLIAVSRDIGISDSALDYILRLRSRFTLEKVENLGMNWSKFQEVLDIKDDAHMEEGVDLIRSGQIKSRAEIREFKRRANAGLLDPRSL